MNSILKRSNIYKSMILCLNKSESYIYLRPLSGCTITSLVNNKYYQNYYASKTTRPTVSQVSTYMHLGHSLDLTRKLTTLVNHERCILSTNISFEIQKRYKKIKKRKTNEKDESDDDSDYEQDEQQLDIDDPELIDGKSIGFKDITTTVPSMRLDVISKAGLGYTRAKVEELFYDSRLRVNGERVAKKSHTCNEGDEIDAILGLNSDNTDMLDVARVVIKSMDDKSTSKGRDKIKLRKFSKITIPNYVNDPYTGLIINTNRESYKDRDNE